MRSYLLPATYIHFTSAEMIFLQALFEDTESLPEQSQVRFQQTLNPPNFTTLYIGKEMAPKLPIPAQVLVDMT